MPVVRASSVFLLVKTPEAQVRKHLQVPKYGIKPPTHIVLSAVLESMRAVLQLMLPSSSSRSGALQVAFRALAWRGWDGRLETKQPPTP